MFAHPVLLARAVQTRRGDLGPLSPDHLREAYRAYQEESGHVGAARPLRAKSYSFDDIWYGRTASLYRCSSIMIVSDFRRL